MTVLRFQASLLYLRSVKILASIFLSLVILLQSVVGTLVMMHYQANKKYIASTLCENKNKPSKKCEGKCYLKKQLKKAEEAEKSLPGTIKEKMEAPYVMLAAFEINFSVDIPSVSHASNYTFFVPESHPFHDPHPPRS